MKKVAIIMAFGLAITVMGCEPHESEGATKCHGSHCNLPPGHPEVDPCDPLPPGHPPICKPKPCVHVHHVVHCHPHHGHHNHCWKPRHHRRHCFPILRRLFCRPYCH